MIDTVGTPTRSTAALARNTAGVQAPQAPMADMTASTFLTLLRAVNVAEDVVSHELYARVPGGELFAKNGKYVFAAEQVVPHFPDDLAGQIGDPIVGLSLLYTFRPEGPHGFELRFC